MGPAGSRGLCPCDPAARRGSDTDTTMKTGIHFERCNVLSAELHNNRDVGYMAAVEASGKKTYDLFHDRTGTNRVWINPDYKGKTLPQLLDDCRQRYRDLVKQEPQEEDRVRTITDKKTGMARTVTTAGWTPIREGICPVKADTTTEDFRPVIDYLENKGVHVIGVWIHRDEGYQDPLSGERKYNLHAHVVADWTNHATGKTAKLGRADMSHLNQEVLPLALDMEPGYSKEVTGAEHLTPAQQREKAAAMHAVELHAQVKQLEATRTDAQAKATAAEKDSDARVKAAQARATTAETDSDARVEAANVRAATAEKKAAAVETTAKREQLRGNLLDVGARVAGWFGRGAIAEANAARDEALERAATDETRAADEQKAREAAEETAKTAENARIAAETARRTAEEQKAAYGKERYEEGHKAGYAAGRRSVAKDIDLLNRQNADKQDEIDKMANKHADEISRLKTEHGTELAGLNAEHAKAIKKLKEEHQGIDEWIPWAKNWEQYRDDMRQAGLSDDQIKQVFRNGTMTLPLEHHTRGVSRGFKYDTTVWITALQTAANRVKHGVWFRARAIDDAWRTVGNYLDAVRAHIWKSLGQRPQTPTATQQGHKL